MTSRRSFLSSCLALAAAPAIVRADSLMRVVPRETKFVTFRWIDYLEQRINDAAHTMADTMASDLYGPTSRLIGPVLWRGKEIYWRGQTIYLEKP